ncbi:MAG: UDP-N-acetylglucosamine diphosphorylase/glucosamine-1-phosphate N-acetyltransferase [Chitinophagales bacterium]|jgi:UDP-N-acetylglucosamine diphosphorylase/glucosamine-1-phosphate N-acetyltransferase
MSKPVFVLSDHYENWINLNPLTLTKPVSLLRVGITTIQEKWESLVGKKIKLKTCVPYLKDCDSWMPEQGVSFVFINSSILPNQKLCDAISLLTDGQSLYKQGELIASKITLGQESLEEAIEFTEEVVQIKHLWDIFSKNEAVLRQDFEQLTKGRQSDELSQSNTLIGPKNQLFLESGAKVEGAILNTSTGPIYIGKSAEVMEGALVRGALALCDNAVLKLGAKIYGATTIGPFSKVGGEVNNSVIQGYSNKGHDGFLGNSVIGEWCNLGADTNNSNLKNNYGEIKIYSFKEKGYINSNLQFLGLIMGDHSKCAINTMFNTGTVIGVFANVFGSGFPPKYIPSFSWGGSEGFSTFNYDKALEVAERVMSRRQIELTLKDKTILKFIHETSEVQ